ncbi:MAG: hypothetical protein MK085_01345 [Phycisphaerales bacterium]|nr:hypothetical protein [Phycisphaerales bacterium]
MTTRVFVGGLACLLMVLASGCSTPQQAPRRAHSPLTMRVFDRDGSDRQYMLYALAADGTMSGSGGFAALQGEFTWNVVITPEERTRLLDRMQAAGWLDGSPESNGGTGPRQLVVSVRTASGDQAFQLDADGRLFPVSTEAILAELQAFSLRRVQDVIDGLPQVGEPLHGR